MNYSQYCPKCGRRIPPPAPRKIYKPVYYDLERNGFYYQKEPTSPLYGPFRNRESAVADALWQS
jgi:hypothetical protein